MLYESILTISIRNSIYMERIESNSKATGSISQLSISGLAILSYVPKDGKSLRDLFHHVKSIAGGHAGPQVYLSFTKETLVMSRAQKSFIRAWLLNKRGDNRGPAKSSATEPTQATKDYLQSFVNAFWALGAELERQKKLLGTKFAKEAPVLLWATDAGAKGRYTPAAHSIMLAYNYLPGLDKEVEKFRKDPRIVSINDYKSLKDLISKYPGSTLIHELGHAWLNGTGHSGHSDVTLTVLGDKNPLQYEYACSAVYRALIQEGLENKL